MHFPPASQPRGGLEKTSSEFRHLQKLSSSFFSSTRSACFPCGFARAAGASSSKHYLRNLRRLMCTCSHSLTSHTYYSYLLLYLDTLLPMLVGWFRTTIHYSISCLFKYTSRHFVSFSTKAAKGEREVERERKMK